MHGVGILLLCAVAGYWVLERASEHKGSLRRIGLMVGTTIIILGLLGAGMAMSCGVGRGGMKGGLCPFHKPYNVAPR